MKQIILALVALFVAASVQAQTFARVVTKTPSLTIMEVGDNRGLWALDIFSVDIHFNGGSMIAQLLAAALHESVPLPANGRGIRWSVPNQDTVRLTVHGIDVSQYLIGIRACDLARVCADNSAPLPRFLGAASPTNNMGAGAITVPVEWFDSNVFNVSGSYVYPIFEFVAPTDVVITGFQGIGNLLTIFTPNPLPTLLTRGYINIWSSFQAANASHVGDVVTYVPVNLTAGAEYMPGQSVFEMRANGASIYLPAGTYYITVPLQAVVYQNDVYGWGWVESLTDLGTEWSKGAAVSTLSPLAPSPAMSRGTLAVELLGYSR